MSCFGLNTRTHTHTHPAAQHGARLISGSRGKVSESQEGGGGEEERRGGREEGRRGEGWTITRK